MDYIQIDRINCMEIILERMPRFQNQWEEHIAAWNLPLDRPIALDIAEFADFTIDTIRLGEDLELDNITILLEQILLEGDALISYAFRTMFLEQIAHRSSKLELSIDRFIDKLQPVSYYHWQALDRSLAISPSGVIGG
jgi:hypothetical protein